VSLFAPDEPTQPTNTQTTQEILESCVQRHFSTRNPRSWIISNGPTWEAHALRLIEKGRTTPEDLFDPARPWRLRP